MLTAFIYPIVGAWTWGGGWLHQLGFQDFAGSTIVHGTGGWAALAGALMVGPRRGKFPERTEPRSRRRRPTFRSSPWECSFSGSAGFGFNGGFAARAGKRRRRGGDEPCAGQHEPSRRGPASIAAIAMSRPLLGRVELLVGLNGAIAGLVSITAGPRDWSGTTGRS